MGKRLSRRWYATMVEYMAVFHYGLSLLYHDRYSQNRQGSTLVPWILLLSQSLQWRLRTPPWRCKAGAMLALRDVYVGQLMQQRLPCSGLPERKGLQCKPTVWALWICFSRQALRERPPARSHWGKLDVQA